LQIDYDNMLACFPGNEPPQNAWDPRYPYGAHKKAGTNITVNNFVSPLQPGVGTRFNYTHDGLINTDPNDEIAASTAEILGLNHSILVDLRKAAIDERVFNNIFTPDAAEELSQTVMIPDAIDHLPEFCVALSQVAAWYASQLRGA
jgi:hypothetical protein